MISKKNFIISFHFVVLIFFAGCKNNIEGIYVANHEIGYDTLKIYPDNKFLRIYYDPNYKMNSRIYADTGTWKYERGSIYFRGWIDRCEGVESLIGHRKIILGIDVNKSLFNREIKLIIDYDKNYFYKKQK